MKAALSSSHPMDLFNRYQKEAKFTTLGFRRTLPKFIAYDELYNTALLGLWQAAVTWRDDGCSFNHYAQLCMQRTIIDFLRRTYRNKKQNWRFVSLNRKVPEDPTGERGETTYADTLLDKSRSGVSLLEIRDELDFELSKLPPGLRGILEDYFLQELTTTEIAKKRNLSKGVISSKIHAYRLRLGSKPRNRRVQKPGGASCLSG